MCHHRVSSIIVSHFLLNLRQVNHTLGSPHDSSVDAIDNTQSGPSLRFASFAAPLGGSLHHDWLEEEPAEIGDNTGKVEVVEMSDHPGPSSTHNNQPEPIASTSTSQSLQTT